jgi:dihydropteroate synthase
MNYAINCKGKILTITQPIVMGIINTTPDSFFANSRVINMEAAVQQAANMVQAGATILDIGGQSTRPGATQIGAAAEAERVLPIIEAIHKAFPDTLLSVDTYHAYVAKHAVAAGACMVNDISGGLLDTDMLATVAELRTPYICMHMQGTPETMQTQPSYQQVVTDVLDYFIARISACTQAGIHDVIVDVGFGFGKTIAHNFTLLKQLSAFQLLQKPLLVGLSRKSTIYKTLNITAEEALNGTTVLNTIALQQGAAILRVHDVKAACEAITLLKAMKEA